MSLEKTKESAVSRFSASVLQGLSVISTASRKAYFWILDAAPPEDRIHPDFANTAFVDDKLTWYQNREWGTMPDPEYKVGFYFNDPHQLDDCPWICKIGNNRNPKFPQYKYFCVGYGDGIHWDKGFGVESMVEWVKKFDSPSLMKYDGTLLKMLGPGDTFKSVVGSSPKP